MLFPYMVSRRVRLRPATAADGWVVYHTLVATGVESVPEISEVTRVRGSNAMFLATRRSNGEVLGFSTLHGYSDAGHMKASVFLDTRRARFGMGSEVVPLTINYGFAMFPIDKMIVETTEASFHGFGIPADGGGDEVKEAVFPEHLYFRGREWDLHSFPIDRRAWTVGIRTGSYAIGDGN